MSYGYSRRPSQSTGEKFLAALDATSKGAQRVDYLAEDAKIDKSEALKIAQQLYTVGELAIVGTGREVGYQTFVKRGSSLPTTGSLSAGQQPVDRVGASKHTRPTPSAPITKEDTFEKLLEEKPNVWKAFKQEVARQAYRIPDPAASRGEKRLSLADATKGMGGMELQRDATGKINDLAYNLCRKLSSNPGRIQPSVGYIVGKIDRGD